MVLLVLRKLILQTRMRSRSMRLDIWFLFGRTLCLLPYFMCANSEGSGETALMRRLVWAFAVACVISTIISWAGWNDAHEVSPKLPIKRIAKLPIEYIKYLCFLAVWKPRSHDWNTSSVLLILILCPHELDPLLVTSFLQNCYQHRNIYSYINKETDSSRRLSHSVQID